jgi:hypothetical protein
MLPRTPKGQGSMPAKTNNSIIMTQLKEQLADIGDRYPNFAQDDLFVAWFLRAYVTEDEKAAIEAVAGGSRDKGIDAIYIDHKGKAVFIVQGKYRKHFLAKLEDRKDVISFAELASVIYDPDHTRFNGFVSTLEARSAGLFTEARQHILKSNYKLGLLFITLGRVSPTVTKDAYRQAKRASIDVGFEILSGKRIALLLRDYLDGAAPPIPSLDLQMESGGGIDVNGILQRYDSANQIESWVFPMKGSDISTLVEAAGTRIFARNIRGFLGDNPVNKGMNKTLENEADHFFYYNNGITIVCDHAERISSKGRDTMRVTNPQIINGQQTSRVLAMNPTMSQKATVVVRVIRVPREEDGNDECFDAMVSKIVGATNWQTAIKPSDLMANDRLQIEIERTLRKRGYFYIRKRQTKREIKHQMGYKRSIIIKKEDLAQVVAGCDLDPVIARSGKDNLFEEQYYHLVFPNTDADAYLSRYWLAHEVTYCSREYPQRGYAKWLVLGFMWSHFSSIVRADRNARAFRCICERREYKSLNPLWNAINIVYIQALKYYNANKGRGDKAMDISTFFHNKKGRDKEFERFWAETVGTHRSRLEKCIAKVNKRVVDYLRNN